MQVIKKCIMTVLEVMCANADLVTIVSVGLDLRLEKQEKTCSTLKIISCKNKARNCLRAHSSTG